MSRYDLTRTESDNVGYNSSTGQGGDPRQVYWYFDGRKVGAIGNNGNDDPDYAAALDERTVTPWGTPGAFRNGGVYANGFADFDQAYNAISPGEGAGPGGGYIVRSGDTLSSIAQAVLGDASLWYLIAEANGLSGGASLSAGQSLALPGKFANLHNTSGTFRPYDPARALGDTLPTTPAPPKNGGCGVFGAILLAVVAVAVTILALPSGGASVGIGKGILAGLAGAAASNVVGLATGIQDSVDWKGIALAGIGGGVAAALGPVIKGTGFFADALRAAAASAITQGIGVATGLQDEFSWAGVAAAGVGGGVGGRVGAKVGGTAGRVAAATAAGLANAATRSVIDGTDFGDNVLAALPDVIGSTIGSLVADGIASAGRKASERADRADANKSGSSTADNDTQDNRNSSSSIETDAQPGDIVVTAQRQPQLRDFSFYSVQGSDVSGYRDTETNGLNLTIPSIPRTFARGLMNDGVFRTIDGIPVDQYGELLDIGSIDAGFKTRFSIDILQEDKAGGHTYEFHIGKSDEFLKRRLSTPLPSSPKGMQIFLTETSTFTSLKSANRLVNSTLSLKAYEVDSFLRGTDSSKFITAYFPTPTGKTMYSTAPVVSRNRNPGSFRTEATYGVGVVIQRAPYMPNGFYVKTSYPIALNKTSPFNQ